MDDILDETDTPTDNLSKEVREELTAIRSMIWKDCNNWPGGAEGGQNLYMSLREVWSRLGKILET